MKRICSVGSSDTPATTAYQRHEMDPVYMVMDLNSERSELSIGLSSVACFPLRYLIACSGIKRWVFLPQGSRNDTNIQRCVRKY